MLPDQVPAWDQLGLSTCYQLTLQLQEDASSYTGHAKVTFQNRTGVPLSELVFRLYPNSGQIYGGALDVASTAVDGTPVQAEVFLSDKTGLRVPLPASLSPDSVVNVDMDFRGQYPIDFGDSSSTYGVFNYTSADKVLALANWYPILAQWDGGEWQAAPVIGIGDAVVSQTALYLVAVDAPEAWQIVTTGSQIEQSAGNGRIKQVFSSGPARDFTVLASPNFSQRKAQVDGITVQHWGLPDGEPRWDEAIQAAVDSVSIYDERFGQYPYQELDVVAIPLKLASGVEYPGLFLMGKQVYQPDSRQPFLLGLVVAHEAAHQWWYGVVGNDVLEDPWQDEALATFSSLLYQQVYQPANYQGTIDYYQSRITNLPPGAEVDAPVASFQDRPSLYSPVVYLKGALFFVAVRSRIGDQAFYDALHAYYSDYRYELASPADLLGEFERSCGCSLDDLYRKWGVE